MNQSQIDVVVYTHDMVNTSAAELREVLEAAEYDVGLLSVRSVTHYADEYAHMVTGR